MIRSTRRILFIGCVLLATACQAPAQKPPVMSSRHATSYVDYAKASYTTPVTRFVNTPEETARIEAAQALRWSECVLGKDRAPETTVEAARRNLTILVNAQQTRFGYFNAQAVAAGAFDLKRPGYDSHIGTSPQDASRCAKDPTFVSGEPLTLYKATAMETLPARIATEAWEKTLKDPHFLEARQIRNSCTSAKGFPTAESGQSFDPGQLNGKDSIARAKIAEAECSDQSGFIYTASSIEANYEEQLMAGHEAELAATRESAIERVRAANQVLAKYGLS